MTTHIREGLEGGPIFSFSITPDSDTKFDALYLDDSYYKYMQRTYGRGSFHSGLDINLKGMPDLAYAGADRDLGYPVRSMFAGEVLFADYMKRSDGGKSGYGRVVKVRTDEYYRKYIESQLGVKLPVLDVVYCHLVQIAVEKGDLLNSGDSVGSIGKSGRTETSYPAHLHLAVIKQETGDVIVPPQGGTDEDKNRIKHQFLDPVLLFGSRSGKLNFSDAPSAIHPKRAVYLPTPAGVIKQ